MKIAVQAPSFLLFDQHRNFNGYNFEFLAQHRPMIYLKRPWHYFRYRQGLINNGLNPRDYEFIFGERSLNAKADLLLCFNGTVYIHENTPPRSFRGMKIWHIMDFVYFANRQNKILEDCGVDYLLAYGNVDRHCGFFQDHYPGFVGRVIDVPFGYGARFANQTPLENRKQKCIALGAINPIEPDTPKTDRLYDWHQYYDGRSSWSHNLRRFVVEHEAELTPVLDSELPHFPKRLDLDYDAPAKMNDYVMFLNDESIVNFPPARTYEGVAAGAIMVALNHPVFRELGFVDGKNCVFLQEISVDEIVNKIQPVLGNTDLLQRLQLNGLELIAQYSHKKMARTLHRRLIELLTTQVP